ncbi:MAG TPA: hypothetical protein VH816_06095 [Gaiellaceae bacterium]
MRVASLVVNGVDMHLLAIAVRDTSCHLQEFDEGWDEPLAGLHGAVGADGHWQTVVIEGREYVLLATPLC